MSTAPKAQGAASNPKAGDRVRCVMDRGALESTVRNPLTGAHHERCSHVYHPSR